jgi:hypothetical protein
MENMNLKEEFFRLLEEAKNYFASTKGIEINIDTSVLDNVIFPAFEKLERKIIHSVYLHFRIPLGKFENNLELFTTFDISFSFTEKGTFSHLLKPTIISPMILREPFYLVINAYFRKKSRAAFELALQDNNIKFNKYENNKRLEIFVPVNVEVMEYVI